MSKPDDVPQEVWDSAFYKMDDFCLLHVLEEDEEKSVQQAIARAIMAAKAEERADCALEVDAVIAPSDYSNSWHLGFREARNMASKAIRSRT